MPVIVTIDDRPARQRLARIQGRFARFGPEVVDRIVRLFHDAMRQQFASEGEWGGQRWAALSRVTLEAKSQFGFGGKGILERTGRLREAFTTRSNDFGVSVSGSTVRFEIKDPVARFHQEGNARLPQRPIVPDPMPTSFIRQLRNIVTGYVLEAEFR